MLIELSILPVGKDESLSTEVAKVMTIIDASGLPYRAGPISTTIEGDWDECMALVKRCHHALLENSGRIITTIKIDDRPAKPKDRITEKLKSVEKKSGLKLT